MTKRNILENSASLLARKSGKMLNIGKLKLNLASLENEIYNLKSELGEVIYQAYRESSDCSSKVEELCARLAEMDRQRQEMLEKVETNKI